MSPFTNGSQHLQLTLHGFQRTIRIKFGFGYPTQGTQQLEFVTVLHLESPINLAGFAHNMLHWRSAHNLVHSIWLIASDTLHFKIYTNLYYKKMSILFNFKLYGHQRCTLYKIDTNTIF